MLEEGIRVSYESKDKFLGPEQTSIAINITDSTTKESNDETNCNR